jgi:pantetheine-phosphate adenylyltransferase
MSTVAVYPGSFNPVTIGHLAIIGKASKIFDKVIVVVARNPEKDSKIPCFQRLEWIGYATRNIPNVSIVELPSNYLLVDIRHKLKEQGIDEDPNVIIRGLRNGTDLDYEMYQQIYNDKLADLNHHMETVYLTVPQFNHISSTSLRSVAKLASFERFRDTFGWIEPNIAGITPPMTFTDYNDILKQIYEAYHE